LDFNDNKSIVKKYMTNNEMIEKINDLFEKDTVKNCSLIDEEIECNL
jgi:ribosomal protein S17E